MESTDYSKAIYQKFFTPGRPEVKIFLENGTAIEGVIVAVFHGNEESGEPYVIKWHIVSKDDLPVYEGSNDENGLIGKIVKQEDVEAVRLK